MMLVPEGYSLSFEEIQVLEERGAISPVEAAAMRDTMLVEGRATPLPGYQLHWEEWNREISAIQPAPYGEHHRRVWEWAENFIPGERPPALIECWARGHGKSTTIEHVIARTCVRGSRSFCLYVCHTQKAADRHVMSIANLMERMGVQRAVNTYGLARGWSAEKLRCANGFNVLSFGLDAGGRGVKLDDIRPDFIVLDDVDELGDSLYMLGRKIETITSTVIPSGSTDVAIAFVQNAISANSVMSQVMDGRADMLMERIQAQPVPAIYGFQWERYQRDDGRMGVKITSGEPSWEGKPLQTCQDEINAFGIAAFLRECQHDVKRNGIFFQQFSEAAHVRRPAFTQGPCLHCAGDPGLVEHCPYCLGSGLYSPSPHPIPTWWNFYGGLDYGRSDRNPFAFLLFAVDDFGNVKVVEEIYEARMSPEEQAQEVIIKLAKHGLAPGDCLIFCDPSFFPKKDQGLTVQNAGKRTVTPGWNMFAQNGKHVSDVYLDFGLKVIPAMNANTSDERVNGWAAVNSLLDKTGGLIIYEGRCPNLIRTIKVAPCDPQDDRDVDTTSEDHLIDCLRFFARHRFPSATRNINAHRYLDAADAYALKEFEDLI